MSKGLFKRKGQEVGSATSAPAFSIEAQGLGYPLTLAEAPASWNLAAYLDQLFEEDLASQLNDRWLLPWESIYQLLADPEHEISLPLLGLPPIAEVQPQLASQGALSDTDFKVFVQGWWDMATGEAIRVERTGAVFQRAGSPALLPCAVWKLLEAVRELGLAQQQSPGEATNQIGWARIRKLARQADAKLDGFLDKTAVIRPEQLRLRPRKAVVAGTPVIELDVSFEGQPSNWPASFEAHKHVQDRYRIQDADGTVTHVLIEPAVKTVLESVKALPGRRVAGDDALSLVRNPYSLIGEEAQAVVAPDEYERVLAEAGIFFHRFRLKPLFAGDISIQSVSLILEPISATPLPEEELTLAHSRELAGFVQELELKLAAGMPAGFWDGYELQLGDFDLAQLEGIKALLRAWQEQEAGQAFKDVMDLAFYGDRVVGIGAAERITSPFLIKEVTETWLPETVQALDVDSELLARWDPNNLTHFEEFEHRLDQAREMGEREIILPGADVMLPIEAAEQLYQAWSKKLKTSQASGSSKGDVSAPRAVLQIEHNIEEATYAQHREATLLAARNANADLPELLRPEVLLREHQVQGVAWMQHLFGLSPQHVAGCLLADDMGLGKTIQLLAFVVRYLEQNPEGEPVLIVAPVSLLDNWERELHRFFHSEALPVLKLYGSTLSAAKFRKEELPTDLRARGIKNLLRPGWIGSARIVLTTYETLRDQEFSLARQHWAVVICDEAQKLKNPAALITQAAKAVPARFRIACTGTPVENTLIDLWCLFDFIQPGFLGGLNQFGREYQRPIEAASERDEAALERLRKLIDPQTLRRTKLDVAKDLPAKIEDEACRRLSMHALQRNLYLSEIARYKQRQQVQEQLEQRESGMLSLLHKLKLICAHPFSVQPEQRLRDHSPKLNWLIQTLKRIEESGTGDKVILFTELRDIQRELQHAIQEHFGFKPIVINGDTSTNSQSAQSRQRLIDRFQEQPGFSVIILSTVAVGFGVNVQAANHVIHFTRCWNPAKEDQATDRAYRIGQEKDVFVYYPTICDPEMPTFEATLDDLLSKRRALAKDMLQGASELQAAEFSEVFNAA